MKDFCKISMFFLSIYPVLWIYSSPITVFNLGDFIFLFLLIVYLLGGGVLYNRFNGHYFMMWSWFAISLLITTSPLKITYLIPGGIRFFVFSMIVLFVINTFNYDYFIKYFRYFFIFSAVIFFMQYIMHLVTGRSFSALIPFLNLTDGLNTSSLINSQIIVERPSSIFREPAHYAQVICVFLIIELFGNKKKMFNFSPLSMLAIAILFLLSSGNALMILLVVLGYYSYYYFKTISINKRIKLIVTIVPLLMIGVFAAYRTGASFSLLERTSEITTDVETATSGYLRVVRGYEVFDVLPNFNKIVGSSEETILKYEKFSNSNFFTGDPRFDLYFNGIQTILLYKGIIGLIIFLLFLLGLYRNNNRISKVLITSFFFLSFIADTYLYPIMLFTFVISLYYRTNIHKLRIKESYENSVLY